MYASVVQMKCSLELTADVILVAQSNYVKRQITSPPLHQSQGPQNLA